MQFWGHGFIRFLKTTHAFFIVFFLHYYLSPLYSSSTSTHPLPHRHHTGVHDRESFFFSTQGVWSSQYIPPSQANKESIAKE